MRNGEVQVTVKYCELVCLRPAFDTEFSPIPELEVEESGGSISNCGAGIGLALFPPMGIRCWSRYKKRKRKNARA